MYSSLNINKWKEYKLSSFFTFKRGHTLSVEDKENFSGNIPCINGTIINNGVLCHLSKEVEELGFEKIKSPALSVVRVGNGGKTFVQNEDFYIADNAFALIPKHELSIYSLFFISVLLDLEQIKYSYGRTVTSDYLETIIKLPINNNGEPDREFMENYIKSLHYKPITTKNKAGKNNLNINKWKEFKVGDLFNIGGSKTTPKELLEDIGDGIYPYVTTSATNNGIEGFYNFYTENGNIIVIESACMGFSTYQSENFSASDHVEVLKPKYYFNKYIGLFIVTLINNENFRYSYGRKCNQIKIRNMIIKLPVNKKGEPDREFMENYIKNLPYGDRI